jgi:hypothetical protein
MKKFKIFLIVALIINIYANWVLFQEPKLNLWRKIFVSFVVSAPLGASIILYAIEERKS